MNQFVLTAKSSAWKSVIAVPVLLFACLYGFVGAASATPTVVSTVDVGSAPSAIASDGTHLWVANANDSGGNGTVTEINASTGQVVGSPISVGDNPLGIADDGTHVWVANNYDGTVTEINASTGQVVGSPISVGDSPLGIADDGTHVWVANSGDGTVTEINAADGVPLPNNIPIGLPWSGPAAIVSDGTFAWVTLLWSDEVVRINMATGTLIGPPISVGSQPDGISFDGTNIWVANYGDNSITEINASSAQVVNTFINLPFAPLAVYSDGQHVWVAGEGQPGAVMELSAATGQVLNTVTVGTSEQYGGIVSDGYNIWSTNDDDDTVSEINPGNVPGDPSQVSGTARASTVTVSWTAPIFTSDSPITNYSVQYSADGGITWTSATMCMGTATSCTVTGLSPGMSYVFEVAATTVYGTGPYSANSPSVTLTAPTAVTSPVSSNTPSSGVTTSNTLASTGSNFGVTLVVAGLLLAGGGAMVGETRRLRSNSR